MPFATVQGLSAPEFLQLLADQRQVRHLVCGENCRIGHNRHADASWLQTHAADFGMTLEVVELVTNKIADASPNEPADKTADKTVESQSAEIISSSHIRSQLAAGHIADVTQALGRPYRLRGTVTRGDQRGRTIGFPTANVTGITNQLPATGVYAALATLHHTSQPQHYRAALNVGYLPTISGDRALTVEAHLLDYSGDCYDQELVLDLQHYIRPEQRFADLDALRQQIAEDVQAVREMMGR